MENVIATLGDLSSIVVGGRADMKHKFVLELPPAVRERVARVINLQAPANVETLQEMCTHLRSIDEEQHAASTAAYISHFMELLTREDSRVFYGQVETRKALNMGAVQKLFVSSQGKSGDISGWKQSAAASSASFVEVSPTSSAGTRFCEGIKVGAMLRYAVDPKLLEEDAVVVALGDDKQGLADNLVATLPEPECDSASTVPSETDARFRDWLVEALALDILSEDAVDSLVVCTEVVLFEDTLPFDERVHNVLEMLRAEGVREEVLLELSLHVSDMLGLQ